MVEFWTALLDEMFKIIITPFLDFDAIWTLIPIYVNWVLTEIFFEFERNDFENAFSNGLIALWVGLGWMREVIENGIHLGSGLLLELSMIISILMTLYGIIIMIEALKGKNIAKYLGMTREVSFLAILLMPFIYGLMELTTMTFIAGAFLFAIFMIIILILKKAVPLERGEIIDKKMITEGKALRTTRKTLFKGAKRNIRKIGLWIKKRIKKQETNTQEEISIKQKQIQEAFKNRK